MPPKISVGVQASIGIVLDLNGFPKYILISSHTARRSFATNLYGKIPDKTIMAITTHKSYNKFMKYLKTNQDEHV